MDNGLCHHWRICSSGWPAIQFGCIGCGSEFRRLFNIANDIATFDWHVAGGHLISGEFEG